MSKPRQTLLQPTSFSLYPWNNQGWKGPPVVIMSNSQLKVGLVTAGCQSPHPV